MGNALRILSANLWYGRADTAALVDHLLETEADVAVFQELSPRQVDAVARVLPHGRLEPREKGARGTGIALRHPGAYSRLAMPGRPPAVAVLDPAHWPQLSRPVELIGVHLAAPHDPGGYPLLYRERQRRILIAHLARDPEGCLVLMGDFNTPPSWWLYRSLCRHLEDVAVTAAEHRNAAPRTTWRRRLRLDHCFARHLTIQDFRVLDLPGSDHDAIFAEFAAD